jgi:hypothetical protein
MSHKRSIEAEERRIKKAKQKRSAQDILLDHSFRDTQLVVGEIVFEQESEVIVRKQLTAEIGYIPQYIFSNHGYGDVLNAKVEVLPVTVQRYTDPTVWLTRNPSQ